MTCKKSSKLCSHDKRCEGALIVNISQRSMKPWLSWKRYQHLRTVSLWNEMICLLRSENGERTRVGQISSAAKIQISLKSGDHYVGGLVCYSLLQAALCQIRFLCKPLQRIYGGVRSSNYVMHKTPFKICVSNGQPCASGILCPHL